MKTKLNGSVDRLAEALRDVVSEAVDEKLEERLEPIRKDMEQQGMLLRAMAKTMLPEDALADAQKEQP